MKILKKITRIFLIGLIIFLLFAGSGYYYLKTKLTPPPNLLSISRGNDSIPVKWSQNEFSNHAAMFVEVNFKAVDKKTLMQVDLGSTSTFLYKEAIKLILIKDSLSIQKRDKYLKEINFSLGKTQIKCDSIPVVKSGYKPKDLDSIIIIGTLGADFFSHKKAIFDFIHNEILISDEKPMIVDNQNIVKINVINRWIMIPAKINKKETKLMWDTGASAFELITNKNQWKQMVSDKSSKEHYQMNSMGRLIDVFNGKTNTKLSIGNNNIAIKQVTYTEGFPWWSKLIMKMSGMKGMIGNQIFINSRVYLDLKNEELSIITN